MAEEKKSTAKADSTKAPAAEKAAPKKDAAKAADKAPAKKAPAKKAAAEKAPAKAAEKAPAKAAADKAPAKKAPAKAAASDAAAEKAPAKKAPAKKAAAPAEEARPQVLKMHHLRPAPGSKTAKTRVGRGEGSKGKTAGRGTKGTKARYQVRVGLEGGNLNSIMRAPKLRGFKNPFRVEYQVVNLEKLAQLYPQGGDVTVSDLVAKGAVRKNEKVKVLGQGDITVKLNVAVDKVSSSAESKIVAAGGSVK
ncbi:50S ribosomal protein L15 [Salinibacterium sp. dk2585]|uniref:50S ribosomal protein L15 n=1 Tax=unclassified Salinibacterium TaxID=2632331 RepID=UPI0011C24B11|nr:MULTISPECIES: 50S ribosomal protein L15 [unclassified Salinibacterium]QEE60632.1 50S ribosomal protein L15 [Salinibacterium sp. dk2585]TXK55704.1 50S ribosomal protein L15 [Salinibacterium sp. dk5596]